MLWCAGIAFVTVVAWIPGHAASFLGASSTMPGALLPRQAEEDMHMTSRSGACGRFEPLKVLSSDLHMPDACILAWTDARAPLFKKLWISHTAGGQERMDYFRNVVALPSLAATGAKLSFKGFVTGELWIALVTFLYIDFLDTTGTLFSMASFINNYIPGVPKF